MAGGFIASNGMPTVRPFGPNTLVAREDHRSSCFTTGGRGEVRCDSARSTAIKTVPIFKTRAVNYLAIRKIPSPSCSDSPSLGCLLQENPQDCSAGCFLMLAAFFRFCRLATAAASRSGFYPCLDGV